MTAYAIIPYVNELMPHDTRRGGPDRRYPAAPSRRRQRVPLPLIVTATVPILALALPNPPPFERSWAYLAVVVLAAIAAAISAIGVVRRAAPAIGIATAAILGTIVCAGGLPYSDEPADGVRAAVRWATQQHHGVLTGPFLAPQAQFAQVLEGVQPAGSPVLLLGNGPADS